jgi:hypothetical protein
MVVPVPVVVEEMGREEREGFELEFGFVDNSPILSCPEALD